jgi:hypothetical protein
MWLPVTGVLEVGDSLIPEVGDSLIPEVRDSLIIDASCFHGDRRRGEPLRPVIAGRCL